MSVIGLISYGLGAAAFAFLAVLMVTSWRGGWHGVLLAGACAATALWAAVLAAGAWTPALPVFFVEATELLRSGLWLAFVASLLAPLRRASRAIPVLQVLALGGPSMLLIGISAHRIITEGGWQPLAMGVHGLFIAGGLFSGLLGLVLLEQLYRNLPQDRRWAMKFLCLGVGVIFAYDLYLYADSLLFRQLDIAAWHARGAVQALAVPLIAVAAQRNRDWALAVFVSRHVAFHTAAVVGAGGYLLLIAVGGYYIRDFGGSWGAFAQIVLTVAAAVALIAVLASGDVRARLRVFLSKHFFSNKYDYREEWLRLTHRLAEENDGLTPYQRAIHVVATIVGSPSGVVWRHQELEGGFTPMGAWHTDIAADSTIADDAPLVTFLRTHKWIIDMAEYRDQPERYNHMTLPAAIENMDKAWAIIPLLQQETVTGFILLSRPDVNTEITWEDRDLLKTLGRQIASYLGQYEDAQALSQARQFEAFNQLTAFLMHDLKNLIAQQSLVVKNADKHKHNPAFVDDAMETIGNSVRRMERLLEHLQRSQKRGFTERVNVERLLNDAVARCGDRAPHPHLVLATQDRVVEADPDEFAMVMVHLIRNAQDATPDDGTVTVRAEVAGNEMIIDVADTGAGMTPEFVRDELFRPFTSTKSSKGMGIGAHQAREFAHRLGGRVSVVSEPGAGTRFRLTLPARRRDAEPHASMSDTAAQTGGAR